LWDSLWNLENKSFAIPSGSSFPPLPSFLPSFSHLLSLPPQTLIGEILKVIDLNRNKLQAHRNTGGGGEGTILRTKDENLTIRTQVLLIRSCLSTLGALTTDLSAFFHPYIPRVLQAVLPLISSSLHFPDSTQLSHDTHAYLSTLIRFIPKRLCIPALVQVTPQIFAMNTSYPEIAFHYSLFLRDLWVTLERNDVINYLISLQTICQYGFQYREMYEGYHSSSTSLSSASTSASTSGVGRGQGRGQEVDVDIDGAICESIIEICLKYTEKELREYLLHLFHWTEEEHIDSSSSVSSVSVSTAVSVSAAERSEWLKYCRCKIFFQFVCELEKKLQSIFIPLMGIVWVYGSEQIMKYFNIVTMTATHTATAGTAERENNLFENKKSKKRKRKDQDEQMDSPVISSSVSTSVTVTGSELIQSELHETSLWILEAVRLCCIHDNQHFIDQVNSLILSSLLLMNSPLLPPPTLHDTACVSDPIRDNDAINLLSLVSPCLSFQE
jgi:hypothetical protein